MNYYHKPRAEDQIYARILAAIMDSLIAQDSPDTVSGYKIMDAIQKYLDELTIASKHP